MHNQNKISRRIFAFGIVSAGICDAATPLINLNKKHSSLIDLSSRGQIFGNDDNGPFLEKNSLYFDPEPELIKYDVIENNFTHRIKYRPQRDFELTLTNANTGEKLIKAVRADTINHGINHTDLDYFLRDWRENKIIRMNKQVVDIFLQISEKALGDNNSLSVQITSGYRTNKTNSYLRKLSRNVAKNSLHIKGQAIDFTIDNIAHAKLKNIAKEHAVGGLGVYDNFIHIDSGPFRRWRS